MSFASIEELLGGVVALSAGAAFLLLPALINGFPFVSPDTEDYLVLTPLAYRSPYYGQYHPHVGEQAIVCHS
jgi:hypothetical protein